MSQLAIFRVVIVLTGLIAISLPAKELEKRIYARGQNKNLQEFGCYIDFSKESTLHGSVLYHRMGKKILAGQYEYGKRVGTWMYWSENDVKIKEEHYQNGQLQEIIYFNHLKKLQNELTIQIGQTIFEFSCYDDQLWNSKCHRKLLAIADNGYLVQDFREGKKQQRFSNPFLIRDLVELTNVEPILYDGNLEVWDKNNNKIRELSCKDGLLEGDYLAQHFDFNKTKIKGYFKQGKREGHWEVFFGKKLVLSGIYTDGVINGAFKQWYTNGKQMLKGQYNKGQREQTWSYWTEKGLLLKEQQYKEGQLINTAWNEKVAIAENKKILRKNGISVGDKLFQTKAGSSFGLEPTGRGFIVKPVKRDRAGHYYRRLLKPVVNGFLVQEFYLDKRQRSSPYVIQSVTELKAEFPKNIEDSSIRLANNSTIDEYYVIGTLSIANTVADSKTIKSQLNKQSVQDNNDEQKNIKSNIHLAENNQNATEEIELKVDGFTRQILGFGSYKDGLKEGEWIYWYVTESNKKLGKYEQGFYKNNKKQGRWTTWYMSGQKSSEGEYKLGKPIGKWIWWNEDSSVDFEEQY